MENEQIVGKLKELLRKCLLNPKLEIGPDDDIFNDLGLDSMGTIEFVEYIEDEYEIKMTDAELKNEISGVWTIGKAADFVATKIAKK